LPLPVSSFFPNPQTVISTEGGALCRRSGEICCLPFAGFPHPSLLVVGAALPKAKRRG
jgi:hypothetical protein